MLERMTGALGIVVAIGAVALLSRDRAAIRWRQVASGLGLQLALAFLVLWLPGAQQGFHWLAGLAQRFLSFGDEGARFLFGDLAGDRLPVVVDGQEVGFARLGTILILRMLPIIVFVSSVMSVLYHVGLLQRVVMAMAWVVRRALRVSGAEALAATANVFLGMTEAPLMIRPYMAAMTRSELAAVMVGGFATISGSMMAVYHALFGVEFELLLAASVLNAPAALYLTKLYLPEVGVPATLGVTGASFERDSVNVVDAAASGASVGLRLALNIGAMLLAFAAGLKLIDALLAWAGSGLMPPGEVLSLGRIFGWLFFPVAWLLGVPAAECVAVGQLLGTKLALNEYFGYQLLSEMQLGERARGIATFALCGFANLGSIAIQLGGIGGLVPERRGEIARLGVPAMVLGALASCITAALAGILVNFGT